MKQLASIALQLSPPQRDPFLSEIAEATRQAYEACCQPVPPTQQMVGISEVGAIFASLPTYGAGRRRGRPSAFVLRALAFDLQRVFSAYGIPATLTFGVGTGRYSDWINATLAVAGSVNGQLRWLVGADWHGKVTCTSPCGSYRVQFLNASPSNVFQACREARKIIVLP